MVDKLTASLLCSRLPVTMSFVGAALMRAAARRLGPASLHPVAFRWYSSGPEHTSLKSVPYGTTLKQEGGHSGPSKPLPRSADVVVIGGGSLGCQTLYHLAMMGMKNAILLERDRLTAGTTWHTAGTAGASESLCAIHWVSLSLDPVLCV